MTEHRDTDITALLDRHTPDAEEPSDWPRVLREAAPRSSLGLRRLGRLRWIPGLIAVAALVALLTALIIAVPGGRTTSAPPGAGATTSPTTLRAYVRDAATPADVSHLRATLALLRREGRIASFSYESKATALRRLRARLKDPSILDDLRANPVPASFAIGLASATESNRVVQALASEPAIDAKLGVR